MKIDESKEFLGKYSTNFMQILDLAMQIQRDTDRCVFIDMMGHINELSIRTGRSKKDYNKDESRFTIQLQNWKGHQTKTNVRREENTIKALKEILKTGRFEKTRYICKNNKCVKWRKDEYLQCSMFHTALGTRSCHTRLK